MKKILFLLPPNEGMSAYFNTYHKSLPTISYGILSIASYIKEKLKDKIEIRILDFNSNAYTHFKREDYFQHLSRELQLFAPDFLGVSGMFDFLEEILSEIMLFIKKVHPHCFLFAGGPCAMTYCERYLQEGAADAISFYEGEIPILRILCEDDPAKIISLDNSWLTLEKLEQGFKPLPEYLMNLDEIPPLNFALLGDLKQYTGVSSITDLDDKTYLSLPIHTTRGCPFNCVFCASSFVHGKKVRRMSAERVISDVQRMVKLYHINRLEICDDQFLLNDSNRIKQMLRELSKLNLSITASSGLSIIGIDDEIAFLLKKAGMHAVSLALESGSEYVLKHVIEKPVKLSTVKDVVSKLKKNGILVHSFIVLGSPGEKAKHRQESREFLETSGFDWYSVVCATPIKGSRLYELCVDKGYLIQGTGIGDGFYRSIIKTEDFEPDEITLEAYRLNLYLNFIHNSNLMAGNYEIAYKYFKYVTNKFPFHAIAWYSQALAEKKLGKPETIWKASENKFYELVEADEEWTGHARYFGLQ